MDVRDLFKEYSHQLQPLYHRLEAESLVFWLFEYFYELQRMDILGGKKITQISPEFEIAIYKLRKGIPIQYITETAPFYGREFKVNPSVLIPRNETEELVHLIIKENRSSCLKILDVGTGSGCIAISLFLEMDRPMIAAMDISSEALDIAKTNGLTYKAAVDFFQMDMLDNDIPNTNLDILVSNPPYVRESEKLKMHQNVLEHEPHLALFVPNKDPLIFYRAIAKKGKTALKFGGKLYFEINESLGQEVIGLLSSLGYAGIRLIKDLNEKDRIIVAINR